MTLSKQGSFCQKAQNNAPQFERMYLTWRDDLHLARRVFKKDINIDQTSYAITLYKGWNGAKCRMKRDIRVHKS